jgi:hypothetical protein
MRRDQLCSLESSLENRPIPQSRNAERNLRHSHGVRSLDLAGSAGVFRRFWRRNREGRIANLKFQISEERRKAPRFVRSDSRDPLYAVAAAP